MAFRGESRKRQPYSTVMKDRFWYLVHQCSQQGALVTATTAQGERITGKLHTIVKGGVKLQDSLDTRQELTTIEGFKSLEFTLEESPSKNQRFKSDAEIVKAKAPGRRELQKYSPDTPITHTLEEHQPTGKYDQFETNMKLFGVQATFDEGQYTTPVVRPEELTPDQRMRAEQLYRDIGRGEKTDDAGGEMEEEERFAAVVGTGRCQPAEKKQIATEINTKVERCAAEKVASPADQKVYRKLRDDLVKYKRLDQGMASIEALQLEVTAFHNDEIADDLEKFKRQKQREQGSNVKQELHEFKEEFDRRSASRKSSILELSKPRKSAEYLDEIEEDCPASLLDLYLDSLTLAEPTSPHWPEPTVSSPLSTPSKDPGLPSLNPDAPEFEFSLPPS